MNTTTIYPIHAEDAARRHWIVRWLRYTGYFEVIAVVVAGIAYANLYFTPVLWELLRIDHGLCPLIAVLLGALVSFVAGLAVTLPVWGLALVFDDLHALRVYASGYASYTDAPDKKP